MRLCPRKAESREQSEVTLNFQLKLQRNVKTAVFTMATIY